MSTTTYTSTNSRPCASCGQPRRCLNTCPDQSPGTDLMFGTIDLPNGNKHVYLASSRRAVARMWDDGLSVVIEAPEKPVERRSHVPRVPVGGIVLVMLGMTLMAFGLVLNEPVSLFIYGLIHN